MFSEAQQGAAARSEMVPAVGHTVFVSYSHGERDVRELQDFL
jgi:hypothetical protein